MIPFFSKELKNTCRNLILNEYLGKHFQNLKPIKQKAKARVKEKSIVAKNLYSRSWLRRKITIEERRNSFHSLNRHFLTSIYTKC